MIAVPSPRTAPLPRWRVLDACPSDWNAHVARCGGGFFHTPLGIRAGAPAGDPVFFALSHEDQIDAVAVGVRHACRLSRSPRHVYLPAPPAVHDPGQRDDAMAGLVNHLRLGGTADLVVDTFDASWQPQHAAGAASPSRQEFTVRLQDERSMFARCAEHHRRKIRHADLAGWTWRAHAGPDARRVLALAQDAAGHRAQSRGAGFAFTMPAVAGDTQLHMDAPWGAAVFAAWRDDTLLSATLVGWGGASAYSLVAGSTPAGYAESASIWLQFRTMVAFAERGLATYNLGGVSDVLDATPRAKAGLERFKLGFGATAHEWSGRRWALRPVHVGGHTLHRRMSAWYDA